MGVAECSTSFEMWNHLDKDNFTPLDKKIQKEYTKLFNKKNKNIINIPIDKTKEENKLNETLDEAIELASQLSYQKKVSRFKKWYKMSYLNPTFNIASIANKTNRDSTEINYNINESNTPSKNLIPFQKATTTNGTLGAMGLSSIGISGLNVLATGITGLSGLPNGITNIPKVETMYDKASYIPRTQTFSYSGSGIGNKRGESADISIHNNIRKRIYSPSPSKMSDDELKEGKYSKEANACEKGLRRFYLSNKDKFLDRVSNGPPESFRWISWIISAGIPEVRNLELYHKFLDLNLPQNDDIQIKKDLNRTLSDVKNFGKEKNLNRLYNVLKAFALSDNEVSYCQGMNFIVGYLLIVSEFNEVETFYMLLSLFSNTYGDNYGLRGFFIPGFPLLNLYYYQFQYYLDDMLPEVSKLIEKLDIPYEAWVGKWFQTLFTISLPLDLTVRLWDCIISLGLDFLINFSISLVKFLEPQILRFTDSVDLLDYLKRMSPFGSQETEKINLDYEELIQDAKKLNIRSSMLISLKEEFEEKNGISMSNFHIKYAVHTPIILNTLSSVNSLTVPTERKISDPCTNNLCERKISNASFFSQNTVTMITPKKCYTNGSKTSFGDEKEKILTSEGSNPFSSAKKQEDFNVNKHDKNEKHDKLEKHDKQDKHDKHDYTKFEKLANITKTFTILDSEPVNKHKHATEKIDKSDKSSLDKNIVSPTFALNTKSGNNPISIVEIKSIKHLSNHVEIKTLKPYNNPNKVNTNNQANFPPKHTTQNVIKSNNINYINNVNNMNNILHNSYSKGSNLTISKKTNSNNNLHIVNSGQKPSIRTITSPSPSKIIYKQSPNYSNSTDASKLNKYKLNVSNSSVSKTQENEYKKHDLEKRSLFSDKHKDKDNDKDKQKDKDKDITSIYNEDTNLFKHNNFSKTYQASHNNNHNNHNLANNIPHTNHLDIKLGKPNPTQVKRKSVDTIQDSFEIEENITNEDYFSSIASKVNTYNFNFNNKKGYSKKKESKDYKDGQEVREIKETKEIKESKEIKEIKTCSNVKNMPITSNPGNPGNSNNNNKNNVHNPVITSIKTENLSNTCNLGPKTSVINSSRNFFANSSLGFANIVKNEKIKRKDSLPDNTYLNKEKDKDKGYNINNGNYSDANSKASTSNKLYSDIYQSKKSPKLNKDNKEKVSSIKKITTLTHLDTNKFNSSGIFSITTPISKK